MRIGLNLASIGVPSAWWLSAAGLAEDAGFAGAWCWDHFISRGRRSDPVLECWTTLAAAAAVTRRIHVGSFVTNVMNRHPAVLARMAATVQDLSEGRLEVGLGIGGHPREHEALGIPFPPADERVARLEEAVQVLRLLWTGGPVSFEGRYYQLRDAVAHPVPRPAPRLVIGGETAGGARLAARLGDAWTTTGDALRRDRSVFEEALAAAGRKRSEIAIIVALDLDRHLAPAAQPLLADLGGEAERWRERGADELILAEVRPEQLLHVLAAAERAGLSARAGGTA
jgi:alkanesulfonate monooxygenase SsuD/methylene tetrahydromethanopterin reductase-like flavin-dependent oxidoreductase (luciferase family)